MLKKEMMEFIRDESAIGVIEVVLILVVLIGLVLFFKKELNKLLKDIFKEIGDKSEEVYQTMRKKASVSVFLTNPCISY